MALCILVLLDLIDLSNAKGRPQLKAKSHVEESKWAAKFAKYASANAKVIQIQKSVALNLQLTQALQKKL